MMPDTDTHGLHTIEEKSNMNAITESIYCVVLVLGSVCGNVHDIV